MATKTTASGSKWHFDPGWIMESAKSKVDSKILQIGNTTLREVGSESEWMSSQDTLNSICKEKAVVNGLSASDQSGTSLRIELSRVNTELNRMRIAVKHVTAQNLALRNENSEIRRSESKLKLEVQSLNDHVNFLRHITAPTPDAGALDVSLAMLRGHELDRSRAKEEDLQKKCDKMDQELIELRLNLTNQTQKLNSAETTLRNEMDNLNSEIAKLVALNQAQERRCENLERQKQMTAKLYEEKENKLRNEFMNQKQVLKIKEENETLSTRIKQLENELQKEKTQANLISERNRKQKQELDLIHAELEGRKAEHVAVSKPSGVGLQTDDLGNTRMIEMQLEKDFQNREKILLNKINDLEEKLAETLNIEKTPVTYETGVNTDCAEITDEDQIMDKLITYHKQLELATKDLDCAHNENRKLRFELAARDAANSALRMQTESKAHRLKLNVEPRKNELKSSTERRLLLAEVTKIANQKINSIEQKLHKEEVIKLKRRIDNLNNKLCYIRRQKAISDADLAASRNEVCRLKTESSRNIKRNSCKTCVEAKILLDKTKSELDHLRELVKQAQIGNKENRDNQQSSAELKLQARETSMVTNILG